ncbi:MAG TPA: hypothetical protein VMI31_17970 [Fimbriimonadaceae bacterium]|nr:hypothetical protein [Fimbriimonadaceae bacterium]
MARIRDGELRYVTPAAWATVAAGVFAIAAAVALSVPYDAAAAATWMGFPWHIALLLVIGVILLLAGANLDSTGRSGKGMGDFARKVVLSLTGLCLATLIPISAAIVNGRTVADATRFAIVGCVAYQAICFFSRLWSPEKKWR